MTPDEPVRWIGIDEAGYGPNLGPLVMSAVVAEGPGDRPPDPWADCAATISRAGQPGGRLWVDDSKQVTRARNGRDRLDDAALAVLDAAGQGAPTSLGGLLAALGAGTAADAELAAWLDGADPPFPRPGRPAVKRPEFPFAGAPWRIVAVRSAVVGAARFNAGLARLGSKASVHFETFAQLVRDVWDVHPFRSLTQIRADKHGGRNFYGDLLRQAFPEAAVEAGVEGPELSRYRVAEPGRVLEIELMPRADAASGLVALASQVSKSVREHAMDAFNAFWSARLPGLRPTAGYPVDAARFRREIEPTCLALGWPPSSWWRAR